MRGGTVKRRPLGRGRRPDPTAKQTAFDRATDFPPAVDAQLSAAYSPTPTAASNGTVIRSSFSK